MMFLKITQVVSNSAGYGAEGLVESVESIPPDGRASELDAQMKNKFALLACGNQPEWRQYCHPLEPASGTFSGKYIAEITNKDGIVILKLLKDGHLQNLQPDALYVLLSVNKSASSLGKPKLRPEQNDENQEHMSAPSIHDSQGSNCPGVLQHDAPPARITPDTAESLLLRKVAPAYPSLARQARVQGTVVLNAIIGNDGGVCSLTLISGHPMLVPAAIGAVKQWHYKPYYFNGKSADVQTEININFSLSGQ
jgi:TonB family protein